jgi:glycosyltransferase involved in cell wall biosynthesis
MRSGLARIQRDVVSRIHAEMKDEFTVATAGYGGTGLESVPWKDYSLTQIDNWLLPELPKIAKHFAGDEELIVMFFSDASRLGWFAHPDWCYIPELAEWLKTAKIKKWIYAPVDAEGPNGHLSVKLDYIYKGFDRVLNYSKFSADVTGYPDYLPHGIDTNVFKPQDRMKAKEMFRKIGFDFLKDSSFLIGIVATNQARKDWPLGLETARILMDRGLDVRVWAHTDMIERNWDIGALVADFGLHNRVVVTTHEIPDQVMNHLYAACDVTLGIGLGEGFGYPIFESLASGTPVLHCLYGGAAEHLMTHMAVPVKAWRYEGPSCLKRPVCDPKDWAWWVENRAVQVTDPPPMIDPELDWNNLWPRWREWLIK